jgi:hypothetical protein
MFGFEAKLPGNRPSNLMQQDQIKAKQGHD